jgi:hypothetical protein
VHGNDNHRGKQYLATIIIMVIGPSDAAPALTRGRGKVGRPAKTKHARRSASRHHKARTFRSGTAANEPGGAAKRWIQIVRKPGPSARFAVPTWVAVDKLTPEERQRYIPTIVVAVPVAAAAVDVGTDGAGMDLDDDGNAPSTSSSSLPQAPTEPQQPEPTVVVPMVFDHAATAATTSPNDETIPAASNNVTANNLDLPATMNDNNNDKFVAAAGRAGALPAAATMTPLPQQQQNDPEGAVGGEQPPQPPGDNNDALHRPQQMVQQEHCTTLLRTMTIPQRQQQQQVVVSNPGPPPEQRRHLEEEVDTSTVDPTVVAGDNDPNDDADNPGNQQQ